MKIGRANKKITRIKGTIKTSPCHSKKKSWRVNKSSITNSWRVFFLSDPGLPRSVVWLMMWCIKTLLMWRTWCKQTTHCELLPPANRRWKKKILWASSYLLFEGCCKWRAAARFNVGNVCRDDVDALPIMIRFLCKWSGKIICSSRYFVGHLWPELGICWEWSPSIWEQEDKAGQQGTTRSNRGRWSGRPGWRPLDPWPLK